MSLTATAGGGGGVVGGRLRATSGTGADKTATLGEGGSGSARAGLDEAGGGGGERRSGGGGALACRPNRRRCLCGAPTCVGWLPFEPFEGDDAL
jgi:hypothetical protein